MVYYVFTKVFLGLGLAAGICWLFAPAIALLLRGLPKDVPEKGFRHIVYFTFGIVGVACSLGFSKYHLTHVPKEGLADIDAQDSAAISCPLFAPEELQKVEKTITTTTTSGWTIGGKFTAGGSMENLPSLGGGGDSGGGGDAGGGGEEAAEALAVA